MRKFAIIVSLVILLGLGYLLAAHFYIYKVIRLAGLPPTDNRHEYRFNQAGMNKMTYVALGDSLTAGAGTERYEESWPYLVADRLAQNGLQIVHKNYSYPGARTVDVIRDLLPGAIAAQPEVVTLLIGTNDIHGLLGLNKVAVNYQYILQELRTKTRAKINVVSVPYIGSDSLLMPPYNYYFQEAASSLNAEIKVLAEKYQANYIDLATPTAKTLAADGPHYSKDKFHPSAAGYRQWAEIIYDHLDY